MGPLQRGLRKGLLAEVTFILGLVDKQKRREKRLHGVSIRESEGEAWQGLEAGVWCGWRDRWKFAMPGVQRCSQLRWGGEGVGECITKGI